jgi:O-acetylhomoserine/O-acetylserine sulfhydrylase-like pyridoxal-dependent enzyme
MKNVLLSIFLLTLIKSGFAQGSYFTCNETGLYLSPSMVTISLPGQSKEAIKQKIMSYIRERKYLYKPFYSGDNQIAFRDFVKCGDKSDCGADLIAKNIFRLTYDSGFIKIRLENEIYSTFYGAELLINENDDVASRKDVPFAPYEFQVPEQYAAEYPEAMYTFNKKGKITLKSPVVQETLLIFYNQYITDMKTFLGGS